MYIYPLSTVQVVSNLLYLNVLVFCVVLYNWLYALDINIYRTTFIYTLD